MSWILFLADTEDIKRLKEKKLGYATKKKRKSVGKIYTLKQNGNDR